MKEKEMEKEIEIEIEKEMEFQNLMNSLEKVLNYKFVNRRLLESVLKHRTERLVSRGEIAISYALIEYLFLSFPELTGSQLTSISKQLNSRCWIASLPVRHCFYKNLLPHISPSLHQKVVKFSNLVEQNQGKDAPKHYDEDMEAPKVLADITWSLAGALCLDCDYNSQIFWKTFGALLKPFVTLEVSALETPTQPNAFLPRCEDKVEVDIQSSEASCLK